MIGRSWLVILLFSIWIGKVLSLSTIRVCQNKHCCKRNPNLLQTISNLVDNNKEEIVVESSGCLSHCETGPNVEILDRGGNSKVLNGMVDVATMAAQLESSGCSQLQSIPKLLIAASKVMERAATIKGKTMILFIVVSNLVGIRRQFLLESPFRIFPFLEWCYLSPTRTVKERIA
jgi:hypothetical protein